MDKEIILNDERFKSLINKLGFNCDNVDVYKDLIFINDYGITIALNSYYDVVEILNVNDIIKVYQDFTGMSDYDYDLGYKMAKQQVYDNYHIKCFSLFSYDRMFSLEEIMRLAHRVNFCYKGTIEINGILMEYPDNSNADSYNTLLSLAYIKFIDEQRKKLLSHIYPLKMISVSVNNIYNINVCFAEVITKLETRIKEMLANNLRPHPVDILYALGEYSDKDVDSDIIYMAIEQKLKQLGYAFNSSDVLNTVVHTNEKVDFSEISEQLLTILNVSDEEVEQNIKDRHEKAVQQNVSNFEAWLSKANSRLTRKYPDNK